MRMASGTPFEIDKRKGVRFMIKEKVIVEYVIDLDTREAALTLEDLYKSKEWKDYGNYDNRKWLFTKFKNNGKVSKTEMNNYECVNREAERIFAERLKIREDTEKDLKRAIELSKIIRDAVSGKYLGQIEWNTLEKGDFSDDYTPGWVTVKIDTSGSKWYKNSGIGHARSCYHHQVPQCVEKEAKELRSIRKKHQYNDLFPFYLTDYPTRVVRVADHERW